MKHSATTLILTVAMLATTSVLSVARGAERYAVLHRFEKDSNENSSQESMKLTLVGNALYGMTRSGGEQKMGTIFRINTDGTGYTVLHEFSEKETDGHNPCGTLTADGDMLFGMTSHGGAGKGGTIFRISTDGASYKVLRQFVGWTLDGDTPYGSLIIDGNTLYGMTVRGGTGGDNGMLFRINKDGNGFAILHNFAGGRTDGASPYGTPTLDGDMLYGMTNAGGQRNKGVIFRVNKDGTGYQLLHHFSTAADNGSSPNGSLLADGAVFYGMTFDGGTADKGSIFRINKDGTGFTILHSFPSTGASGTHPRGGLVLLGENLYGVANAGGRNEAGALFRISKTGKNFLLLRRFGEASVNPGEADGIEPYGDIIASETDIFGMTRRGGLGGGTIFRYQLAIP